jgi:hypothetical protein
MRVLGPAMRPDERMGRHPVPLAMWPAFTIPGPIFRYLPENPINLQVFVRSE